MTIDGFYQPGTRVEKVGGDYTFVGIVVAAFPKLSGEGRFVVEDDRGVLHIYSARNLRPAQPAAESEPASAQPGKRIGDAPCDDTMLARLGRCFADDTEGLPHLVAPALTAQLLREMANAIDTLVAKNGEVSNNG